MVIGVNARLLPLVAWMHAYGGRLHAVPPPSPHDLPRRALQAWVLGLWTAGVPLLAAALALDRPLWLSAAGGALFVAVVLDGVSAALLFRAAVGSAG